MKTKHIFSWLLCFAMVSTVSCSGGDPAFPTVTENPSTDPGTDPGTDPTDPSAPDGSALYFRLGTKWESDADATAFTNVTRKEAGDCIANSVSPDIICSFSIPEGQLYFSKLQFKMGSKVAASCPILKFSPYYYRKSALTEVTTDDPATPEDDRSPGYMPAGGDGLLACKDGKDAKCYGGAAPHMIEGFPENLGTYLLTHVTPESNFVLDSENKLRSYYGAHVNYLVTNDKPTASRGTSELSTTNSQEYVENTFVDYFIWCETYWSEQLFSITVKISDENVDAGGGSDQFKDWPGVNN